MKKICLVFCLFSFALFSSFHSSPTEKQQPFTGFAVVELFTSEGCSSCPPADELLLRLSHEYAGKTVYLLSFHVDYWDKLGWKDTYSDHAYTERQQAYDQLLHVSPYTPQAIVNGKKELIGSEQGNLHNLINASIKNNMPENAVTIAGAFSGNQLTVNYRLHSVDENDLVNVALVQQYAVNRITAGENKGASISHANIVRVFKTVKAQSSGNVQLTIPGDLLGNSFRLIVYTQNKNDLHITAGNTVVINAVKRVTIR